MIRKEYFQKLEYKKLLFEYIVLCLCEWGKELGYQKIPDLSKLRLQKILFFVCAWNTTTENIGLLNVFNNFAALPYGPVELDIYESMCGISPFKHITFIGNRCMTAALSQECFRDLCQDHKYKVDVAIKQFKDNNYNYITRPVFELVDISHQWTVWQVAMSFAEMVGAKKEEMSVEDISNSTIKAF